MFKWMNKLGLLGAMFALPALAHAEIKPMDAISAGDTAWILTSTALVLLMTVPGLALFYGGMVRKKNILSTMVQSFAITALVSVLWMVVGYSLVFSPGNAFIGGLDNLFLRGVIVDVNQNVASVSGTIPEILFVVFQMTFAVISTAIITGAFAERMKFSSMLLFSGLWMMLVYVPSAHWVWGGGFMMDTDVPVIDFAGGTVVHINAGIAGLVAAIVLGKRIGYGKEAMPPHNMALTLTGAALLWVGWFGFNAGSAGAANGTAAMAMAVTQIAAAAAALTWLACEKLAGHRPSALGVASGAVAGLVGITPAAGSASPVGALIIGVVTAVACYFAAVVLKRKLGYDDTLDAFGIHGFGGIVGSILTGLVFNYQISGINVPVVMQVLEQLKDSVITVLYSGVMSWLILKVVSVITRGLRVETDVEREGLDLNIHGERVE